MNKRVDVYLHVLKRAVLATKSVKMMVVVMNQICARIILIAWENASASGGGNVLIAA